MAILSRSFLVLSALALANGFQLPINPNAQKIHQKSFKLFVSGSMMPEDDTCVVEPRTGPATVFGRPLDEKTKEINKKLIVGLKTAIFDLLFDAADLDRCYARFYALENIARMPYFSYVSALHLYETTGRWRKAEYLKVHFSESWNEQHHLLIMEEMGGSDRWFDRFVAQHIAVGYYWMALSLYFFNPTHAYNFNEAVEEEAYATYNEFIEANAEYLKTQPAPKAAIDYYHNNDMYLFDAMHFDEAGSREGSRRPKVKTLYDTFVAIRNDEMEHVKTMRYLQEETCQ